MPTREHDCDHCRHWTFSAAEVSGAESLAATLDALPEITRAARERRGLSVRAAGDEIGISFSTVSRCENGHPVDAEVAAKILRWISKQPGGDQ